MFTCPANIKSVFAMALSELPDDRKIYQLPRLNETSFDYEAKYIFKLHKMDALAINTSNRLPSIMSTSTKATTLDKQPSAKLTLATIL